MTRKTNDVGDTSARSNNGTGTLNNVDQSDTVREILEGGAYTAGDDNADILRIAKRFDDAEALEGRRSALPAFRNYSEEAGDEYAVEGPGSAGEWLVSARADVADLEVWR